MTHAELERLVEQQGRELLRRLFQDHLNPRGPGKATAEVVGANGMGRPHERLRTRTLKTIFGKVLVSRMGYSAPSLLAHIISEKHLMGPAFVPNGGSLFPRRYTPSIAASMSRWLDDAGATAGATVIAAAKKEALATAFCLSTDATGVAVSADSDRRQEAPALPARTLLRPDRRSGPRDSSSSQHGKPAPPSARCSGASLATCKPTPRAFWTFCFDRRTEGIRPRWSASPMDNGLGADPFGDRNRRRPDRC